MTKSQELYQKAKESGMIRESNYIKFKGTGEHIVVFLNDQVVEGRNYATGKPEKKVRYTLNENGVDKTYETAVFKIEEDEETGEARKRLSSFVENMNEFNYGDKLKMEYQPIKGTPRGFISIKKVDSEEVSDEDIPVIEEDEPEPRKVVPTDTGRDMDLSDISF